MASTGASIVGLDFLPIATLLTGRVDAAEIASSPALIGSADL
jgi:hypothetical protein